MHKKEWLEIRPIVESILAFILYLRFGEHNKELRPAGMLVLAKIFTTQFEQEFHFEDD